MRKKRSYKDILEICKPVIEKIAKQEETEDTHSDFEIGEVYLIKSGSYYKIGKSKDAVRRGQEISPKLPEPLKLIFSIRTDDPTCIEQYWQKRFEAKRKKGEWFDLNPADVKAFKRWRRIV